MDHPAAAAPAVSRADAHSGLGSRRFRSCGLHPPLATVSLHNGNGTMNFMFSERADFCSFLKMHLVILVLKMQGKSPISGSKHIASSEVFEIYSI